MKRNSLILILFIAAIANMAAQSQPQPPTKSGTLEIVTDSYRNTKDKNRDMSGADLGVTDMTAESIDWKTTDDGDDINSILIVEFEDMAADDIKELRANASGGVLISDVEDRIMNGKMVKWLWVPESSGLDIDFTHPKFGAVRLSNKDFARKNVYLVKIRNTATMSINVSSDPSNAIVRLDNFEYGTTPLTIANIKTGEHVINLEHPDKALTKSVADSLIYVSSANTNFDFKLRKSRPIVFVANPKNATLRVVRDQHEYGVGRGRVALANLEYGQYIIYGDDGKVKSEKPVEVSADSPSEIEVRVIDSRVINVKALQNNLQLDGAMVTIDGKVVGNTPTSYELPYGKHKIEVSYDGDKKSKTVNVNKTSDPDVVLTLPKKTIRRFNPFEIDYHKRAWGLSINYISKTWSKSPKGSGEQAPDAGDEPVMEAPADEGNATEGYTEKQNYKWGGDPGRSSGIQVGISYQPYFGYGQGLITGVYWEGIFGGSVDDRYNMNSSIYIPLQYQFRLPLHTNTSVYVNFGASATFGIYNGLYSKKEYSENEKSEPSVNLHYGGDYPKAVDCALLYGFGFQWKGLQIDVKFSNGLLNLSDNKSYSCKSQSMIIGLSYVL